MSNECPQALASSAHRDIAIVTGASGEIGGAIAMALSSSHFVALHCHQHGDRASALLDRIVAAGGEGRVYQADLRVSADVDALIERIIADEGRIDVLINNAGGPSRALVCALSDVEFERSLSLNVKSVLYLCRAASRWMIQARRGVIINVSSVAATRPLRGNAAYVTAKAAIEGLTRALSVELAPKGIRVNAVAPGIIETAMTRDLRQKAGTRLLRRIAAGRFGTPVDVAGAVAYLVSPSASYVYGQVLHVDGGAADELT